MMRRASILAVTLALLTPSLQALPDQSLEQLESKAEAARLEDRPSLYLQIAERQLKAVEEACKEGKATEAQGALHDVVLYAGKARDAAIQSGKKIKNLEIAMRKMAEKLRDVKRTVDFDEQQPIQAAADDLEKIRIDLLSHMFGKGNR